MFVVWRDGGAAWSKSSDAAFRLGWFFRTTKETFMLPNATLAARDEFNGSRRAAGTLPPGVWFSEETEEMSVRSHRYDLTLTLLHLPKEYRYQPSDVPLLFSSR